MSKKQVTYEIIMGFLALIVVSITIIQMNHDYSSKTIVYLNLVDNIIWLIFVADYLVRFINSENKKKFFFTNKIDLLVIIPFDELFMGLRIIRLAQFFMILKAFAFIGTYKKRADQFFKTNHFHYIVAITVTIIFIGAFLISMIEGLEFDDALWWSFVTATTVGYGDISPATNLGRIIAVFLMIVGIGFIGMLTGTVATYFLRNHESNISYHKRLVHHARDQLDDFENLSEEDLDEMFKVLKALKLKEKSLNYEEE